MQEQQGSSPSANILAGGLDEVFTRTDAGGAWSPLFDGLGSTLALADSTGTVQTQYTYEPFGKTTTSGSANGNTSQYTGRENDGTGLYYYRARYYSPSLQRFVSEDPIGLLGGINLYGYVENNPLSYRDPFGFDKNDPSDGNDIVKALQDFVNSVKKFITDKLIPGAAAEPLAPMLGSLTPAMRLLPANARTFHNVNDAYKHLEDYHGINPILASERLHDIKAVEGLGAADNVLIDMTGNVYNPRTFEWLGTLTQGGARRVP